VCGAPLNSLVMYNDVPFFWDNWDICHHSLDTVPIRIQDNLVAFTPTKSETEISLTFEFKISEKSSLKQRIIFYSDSPRIDFRTEVEWFERKKFLKALFPVNLVSDYASFECGSGLIRRPRHANTEWDQARYEVCGHRFCDVSEAGFGVAVLNDCKFGYSVRDNTIGLSLLKAGEFPWEMTDKCKHEFTYSLLCHERPLTEPDDNGVFEHAMYLNSPIWAVTCPSSSEVTLPSLVQVSP